MFAVCMRCFKPSGAMIVAATLCARTHRVYEIARATQARKQPAFNCRDETGREMKGGGRESVDGRQSTAIRNNDLRMNKWQIRNDSTPAGSTSIQRIPIPHT